MLILRYKATVSDSFAQSAYIITSWIETSKCISLTNLFVKNDIYCQDKNSLKSCEDGKQEAKGRDRVINWQNSKEQTNAHQHQQNTSSTHFIPEKISPIQNA